MMATEMLGKHFVPYEDTQDRVVCVLCHKHYQATGSKGGVRSLKYLKSSHGHVTHNFSWVHPDVYSQCTAVISSKEKIFATRCN